MMNPIFYLLESEALKEVFLHLVNASISASWLILAVLVLRAVMNPSPKWAHVLLWGIVAVRLLCPISIEFPLSLIPSTETVPLNIEMAANPAIDSGIGAVDRVINPVIAASFTPDPMSSMNPLQLWIPLSAVVWLLGAAVMAIYTAVSYLKLRRHVAEAVLYRDNIFQSENIESPFVLGIIRPRIYLPFRTSEEKLPHIIAHEQAHIRRRDHWWKPLGFLLLTLHWFNPLMWLAYILLCRDIELACDEKVIKELGREQRADYTLALLSCSVNRRMIAACPLAFGEVGVKERVKSVMNYKKPAVWAIVITVILCVTVAVCFLTNPKSSTIYDIYKQDGYTVIGQEEVDVTLYVDKSKLPDSIYTAGGHEFKENEVVVYSTETTKVYLYKAMISNESDDLLYFIFDFSYDFPKAGSIISPYMYTGEHDGTQSNLYLRSKDLRDVNTAYPDALNIRGYGPGTQFAIYVSKDACQAADKQLMFDIVCNQIVYAKEGHGYESQHDSNSKVTKWFDYTDDPSQMSYENELKIQLDEFPNITFKYTPYEIIATTGWDDSNLEGHTILISGMPIWNAYFTDLTGDGMPDLCSSLSMGSGMIDNQVIVFDYANGVTYKLEDRGSYDYYLRMDDTNGCLYVDKKVYRSDNLVSSGKLVFKDGYIRLEDVNETPTAILQAKLLEVHEGYFLVEPIEGSWELNSADKIEIPMKNMNPSPEPEIGDILQIEYDGQIQETYPARISNPYSISVAEEAEAWDLIPMVMVDGVLYLDTGKESPLQARCGLMDGEITSSVDGGRPTQNDQSNFGTGYGYQRGTIEGTIDILMNDKWWIYATEEAQHRLQFPTDGSDLLEIFRSSLETDETTLVTDYVYAEDGAYGLKGVVQYADETGAPWKLAFIHEEFAYPVSQDWGGEYAIASRLSYLGGGKVKVYVEHITEGTFYECTMTYSYDEAAKQTDFISESHEVTPVDDQWDEIILHMGLNAEIIDIDEEAQILYVKDIDESAAIFGERCGLVCTDAAEGFNLLYVNYSSEDVRTIDFSDFMVGDEIIVSLAGPDTEAAFNGMVFPYQVQLGTQRMN